MCEPISAATALKLTLAASAAQQGLSLASQHEQAKSQASYQQELARANNTEAGNQLSQLRIQQAQSRESAARETQKAKVASRGAKATATVAAGEAGVSGNSVEAMLAEYSMNLGSYKETIKRQRSFEDAGYTDQVKAIQSGARYQNLQINAPVVGPNFPAALLNFGGSALGAYREYKKEPK